MHSNSNYRKPLLAYGGFTGVPRIRLGFDNNDNINAGKGAVLHLTNGTFTVADGFDTLKSDYQAQATVWYPELHILAGATLAITSVKGGDSRVGFSNGTAQPRLYITGGTLRIDGRDSWNANRRIVWSAGNDTYKGYMAIKNGGAYIDNSTSPADLFQRFNVSVNGGSIIQTNCVPYTSTDADRANDGYRTISWYSSSKTFTVEDGVVKVPRIKIGQWHYNWLGRAYGLWEGFNSSQILCSDNVFTFKNSQVKFAFAPGCAQASAGIALSPKTLRNKVSFLGASGSCTAHDFLIYGYTNSFEVADGTFTVNGHLVAGIGDTCSVTFTNCTAQIAEMPILASATNFTLGVKGAASVSVGGGLSLMSPGTHIEFAGESPSLSFAGGLNISSGATFSFTLPEHGWTAAPLASTSASSGGAIASDTKFEFDVTRYSIPKNRTLVPLIRSASGFSSIDVGALTSANSDRLPSNSAGVKSSLVLGEGGKTLYLRIPGVNGFFITFH